jgi:tetratricopeptide (TPR) repeat protein
VSAALLLAAAALAAPGRVLVFPPAGPDRGAPGWIGAAVEETLPRSLQRVGIDSVSSSDRRRALEALGITTPSVTRATAIRVAEAFAARYVLFGSWDLGGGQLALTLEPLDVLAAELRAPLVAAGPVDELGRILSNLAQQLAGRAPSTDDDAPFAVLQALGEGLAARDVEARIQGLRRAIALRPGHPDAALALARLLYDSSRFAEAREVLAALRAGPVFERERQFLDGACLLGLAQYAEADVVYAGLAARDATPGVLANRAAARLRVLPGRNGASTLLRQALDKSLFAAELPFGLGWAHFVEGDFEAASFWLRDAVRYAPSDARARLALSWALRGTAQADEADEQWRAAAALDASLQPMRGPDATRRLERVLPSEASLVVDPERRADPRRVLRER